MREVTGYIGIVMSCWKKEGESSVGRPREGDGRRESFIFCPLVKVKGIKEGKKRES